MVRLVFAQPKQPGIGGIHFTTTTKPDGKATSKEGIYTKLIPYMALQGL